MRNPRFKTAAGLLVAAGAMVAVVAVALAGCGGGASKSGKTESSMKVRAGQDFTISIKSNPTTGYQWELAGPLDEKVVEKVSSEYKPDVPGGSSQPIGGGGVEVWTFRAVGKGGTDIRMKYVRPWERDATPAEERVFEVTVE
jgi:inhibitor of cysteine peptidase